jgi:hypothetical protein
MNNSTPDALDHGGECNIHEKVYIRSSGIDLYEIVYIWSSGIDFYEQKSHSCFTCVTKTNTIRVCTRD